MIQPSSSEDSAGRDVQLVLQQPFKVREKFATILFYRRMNTHCYELNNIALQDSEAGKRHVRRHPLQPVRSGR